MNVISLLPSPAVRTGPALPAIVMQAEPHAQLRCLEFFAATIRNQHTPPRLCTRHRAAQPHSPAPGQCLSDGAPARDRGREIAAAVSNHSFRATGIAAYRRNGGTLERAAMMADHSSTRPPSSTTSATTT